jgi:hypothetical protein
MRFWLQQGPLVNPRPPSDQAGVSIPPARSSSLWSDLEEFRRSISCQAAQRGNYGARLTPLKKTGRGGRPILQGAKRDCRSH